MFSLPYQRTVDSKFTGPNHGRYTMAGGNIGGYHNKHHPKPKTIVELQETLQMIWDSLPQEPIDNAVKSFESDRSLVLKLRVDIMNILSDCRNLTVSCCCFNDVIYCEFV